MGPDDVVMTTWHSKQTLEEALGYFAECASPTDGYAVGCRDYVIACQPEHVGRTRAFVKSKLDHRDVLEDGTAENEHLYFKVRRAVKKYGAMNLELPPREIGREPPDFSGDEYKEYD